METTDQITDIGRFLLHSWVVKLANMPKDVPQPEAIAHVNEVIDRFEDTYVLHVCRLDKDVAEIDIKTFNEDCLRELTVFAVWANEEVGVFSIRFEVFTYTGTTKFRDEYSGDSEC